MNAPIIFPGYTRIAFRSTRGVGPFAKPRWVEISLYHGPERANPFILRTEAKSTVGNERTIRTTHKACTLKLILERLDDSSPARSIARQAQAWALDQGVRFDG